VLPLARAPGRLPALAAFALANVAVACPVELVGAPEPVWQEAVSRARVSLAAGASANCSSITVEVVAAGAVVRLTAPDGRLAVRDLHEPTELVPLLQALTVEGPDARSESAKTDEAAAARVKDQTVSDEPTAARVATNPYSTRPLISASVGFRLGADRLITPTAGGTISILNGQLEVGLLARYEAHYVSSSGDNEGRPETSGFALGAQVGAHRELERVALRAGLIGLVAALREDRDRQAGRAEARLGGYVGGTWPSRGKLRLRTDLALEIVPYNLGHSETNALGASSLPWWACGFSIGMELG
jgi:hypothetical protein